MSKLIVLKPPYNQDWDKGYLVINPEGRRTLILYNQKTDRSSTAYARYLYSVSIGRYLLESEHIDHIDNNKTNDSIGNLQVLSQANNNLKQARNKGKKLVEMLCGNCSKKFTRRSGNSCLSPSKSNKVFTCSRVCSDNLIRKDLSKEDRKNLVFKQFVRQFRSHI